MFDKIKKKSILLFFILFIGTILIVEKNLQMNNNFLKKLLYEYYNYKNRKKDIEYLDALLIEEKSISKIKNPWQKKEIDKSFLARKLQTNLTHGEKTDIIIRTCARNFHRTFAIYLPPEDPVVKNLFVLLKKNKLLHLENTAPAPDSFSIHHLARYEINFKERISVYFDSEFNIISHELNDEDRKNIKNKMNELYRVIITNANVYYSDAACKTKTGLSKGIRTNISFFTTPYNNDYFFNEYLLPEDPLLNNIISIAEKYSEKVFVKMDDSYMITNPLPKGRYCLWFGDNQIQLDKQFNILTKKRIFESDKKIIKRLLNDLYRIILKEGEIYYFEKFTYESTTPQQATES